MSRSFFKEFFKENKISINISKKQWIWKDRNIIQPLAKGNYDLIDKFNKLTKLEQLILIKRGTFII